MNIEEFGISRYAIPQCFKIVKSSLKLLAYLHKIKKDLPLSLYEIEQVLPKTFSVLSVDARFAGERPHKKLIFFIGIQSNILI